MMALTPLLCFLQLLLAPFLHESPRWLLQRNPHSAQAALSLKQLYGLKTDQEVRVNAYGRITLVYHRGSTECFAERIY